MLKTIVIFCVLLPISLAAQIEIPSQNAAHKIISGIDTLKLKSLSEPALPVAEKDDRLRAYLRPLCEANDAYACYLLAITYDKFSIGNGTKADAVIAADYYQKAADGQLADACYFLYQMYRYNFMNMPEDEQKSLSYLKKACTYGSPSVQAQCYRDLAGIYYSKKSDMLTVAANNDSTKHYLLKSLSIDTADTWSLDFIGSIYENEKNYDKAFQFYMKSDNENTQIQIARWLAEGTKVAKNIPMAVQILKKTMASLEKDFGYTPQTISQYMGSQNPAVLLNYFYKCLKIIPKKEVGKWYTDAISCDD
ncbi:MAG: sel1 repeat family protein [Chitinophagaceae bacterium]|nr:sel1 repeat family protein [Chitinophagaceae bacterium]